MSFIVAIDGPAGAGKGTITKLVGEKLNLMNIDTGATYRCVTLAVIENGYTLKEEEKIVDLLDKISIEFKKEKTYLNNKDVTKEIRTSKVDNMVSQVSHIQRVRDCMAEFQRKMAKGKDVKIYLDATPEERAKRRMLQNEEKGIQIPLEEIIENIKFRDNNDKTSKVAPLKMAEDAIYVDSTELTIDEVVNKIIDIINQKKGQK